MRSRRDFLKAGLATGIGALLPGCSDAPPPGRYTDADRALLDAQRTHEAASSGKGPYGPLRYQGYRGLAELPWFELDDAGQLRCVADDFPPAIDVHCHLGMSMMLAPELDLLARTERVEHLLDCDVDDPGCPLDLDIYINGNFSPAQLSAMQWGTVAQATWGNAAAATQTIPNLLAEMDAMRVEQAWILPIVIGLPFGDDLYDRWYRAIGASGEGARLELGGSVHPRDERAVAELERQAAAGVRIVKLHPTVQRFYPDDPGLWPIYEACDRLGLKVAFHAGRAGIEPESSHRYAMPRHYEAPLTEFPGIDFVLLHSGARDAEAMFELGVRHENVWFGLHGQSVTWLDTMIRRTGGERLLYGTDWPWYHLGATLAKILMVTEDDPGIRAAVLRHNAERLLPPPGA